MPRLRLALSLVAIALTVGCAGDDPPPASLLDGSPPASLDVTLAGVDDPTVVTRGKIVEVDRVPPTSSIAECFEENRSASPAGVVVARVAVNGESVTFRDSSGHGLYGCDNSLGARIDGRRWCGGAFGRLDDGHLRDPRLDLGACTTADGRVVGFAWLEPLNGVAYVVVRQPRFAEVDEVAGGLPVRVATTDGVEIEGSRASFDVSEHDARGRRVRAYRLETAVAG
jgi:hypothetical protein